MVLALLRKYINIPENEPLCVVCFKCKKSLPPQETPSREVGYVLG